MTEYLFGETVWIGNTFKTTEDVLYDPDAITLKVYDPIGTLKDTVTYPGDITRDSEGVFHYKYTVPGSVEGYWYGVWEVTSGVQIDISEKQFYCRAFGEKLYCTPEDVWVRAGQDETFVSEDNVINYIKQSMAEIDEIYQKGFGYSYDKTEYFDTSQPDQNTEVTSVFLTYTPVRSITSVKEYDTNGNEVADHEAADYWLDSGTGQIQLRSKEFGHQKHRVEVIYTYGFDMIPNKVNNLCIILSAMKVLLNFIGESVDQVTSYNACGISVSVGEPYTAAAKATEILVKERDKLLSEIGRLRPSIFIV